MASSKKNNGCGCFFLIAIVVGVIISIISSNNSFNYFDYSKISNVSEAVSWAKNNYAEVKKDMGNRKSSINLSSYESDFKAANDLFKEEKYADARKKYEDILKKCPVHLGARNNYILSLAHLGENEAALGNAILLGLIHPDYEGNWVNLQIPLAALGYTEADLEGAGLKEPSRLADMNTENLSDYISEAYAYNRVYTDMESKTGEGDMAQYRRTLEALERKSPNDTDYSELLTYLEGLEKNKST